jgi:hypothetical protein
LSEFGEAALVGDILEAAGFDVMQPTPPEVDLAALGAPGENRWSVLHLSSHGIFEPDSLEIGLLLASGGMLPPSPERFAGGDATRHLARPNDLREARVGARLAFLASCVSSRNEAYIGDDLMGVTRAWFAGGTADLVAGAWTVVSSCTELFARQFYEVLCGVWRSPGCASHAVSTASGGGVASGPVLLGCVPAPGGQWHLRTSRKVRS